MFDMKADMGGAAAVVGLLIALARQGSPVHVLGVLGIAKNVGNLVAEPLRADRQPACRSPGETRIAVMYIGSIVEEGPAEEVFSAPAHPYSQALISAVPVVQTTPSGTRKRPPMPNRG
ncbi:MULTISPECIES: ABC transporter ATP-binding protein [Mesorhizobium]|uniref:ABC transporter ATP-binding protein n=2 Tax=Mesorhizobium australicum TaxID=536018 RepID=UPI003EB87BF8